MILYNIAVFVMLGLSLIKPRGRPFAVVLIGQYLWTLWLESMGAVGLYFTADAAAFYAMIWLLWFWRFSWWGTAVAILSGLAIPGHLIFQWYAAQGIYVGVEYHLILNGFYFAAVALTLLGGYDAFSRVASFLARLRGLRLHASGMGGPGRSCRASDQA